MSFIDSLLAGLALVANFESFLALLNIFNPKTELILVNCIFRHRLL